MTKDNVRSIIDAGGNRLKSSITDTERIMLEDHVYIHDMYESTVTMINGVRSHKLKFEYEFTKLSNVMSLVNFG